jgi:IS605 OrfB family transposase
MIEIYKYKKQVDNTKSKFKDQQKISTYPHCLKASTPVFNEDIFMIRSSNCTLKFCNTGKRSDLRHFRVEYMNVLKQFVDLLWDLEKIPTLLPKELTSQVHTWLSARMIQCVGKQASGIVRGTQKKQKKRLWQINEFKSKGKLKQANKLRKIYDDVNMSKPLPKNCNPELDSRFIKIDLENPTSFDGWITITSVGDKKKFMLPFKKHKQFNKLHNKGELKKGVRLSGKSITFMFDIPDVEPKKKGKIFGVDVGMKNSISCSNGYTSVKNNHGHDLMTIAKLMSRKKKGSKAFLRCQEHRKNYINWSINNLNLDSCRQLNIEKIKDLRRYKRTSRLMSHWTYTDIFGKLKSKCSEQGVLVHEISPTYTSQRCSECGWVNKANRNGKEFKCTSCGFTTDADLNASINISLPLPQISEEKRLKQTNRTGFFWFVEGQKPIVSDASKIKMYDFI